jgi:DNA-directed RNA polymerase subunit M/transcription elongation factor TFIIS
MKFILYSFKYLLLSIIINNQLNIPIIMTNDDCNISLIETNIIDDEAVLYDKKIGSASIFMTLPFINESSNLININKKLYLNESVDRKKALDSIADTIIDLHTSILIEASVYEYSLLYCETHKFNKSLTVAIYNDKIKNILYEIVSSPYKDKIIKNIIDRVINPHEIAFLEPHKINPDNWHLLIKKNELREFKKNNMAATDLYKCRNCGERKCSVSHLQTRGIDEPMTTFITCLICRTTFKH